MDEQLLHGGVANAGAVVRSGDHVLRPSNPHTATIHSLLRHVRATGFDGASMPVDVDDDGRERLEFVAGDVPVPPYPLLAQSDSALASVARLLRRFHDASSTFDATGSTWSSELIDPSGGDVICHNDVCLENVVFRDGAAVALLDFDFAAPGRREWDLAHFARMCVPVDDETSAARLGWSPADKPARLRVVADAYGLDARGRALFFEILKGSIERGGQFVRRRVEAGDPNFVEMWNAMGGQARFDRRRDWFHDNSDSFVAELLGPDRKRELLRSGFESASAVYERIRPLYPDELIDHVMATTGVTAGDRMLEVGCGTGKATRAFAERGLQITAIELGHDLAEEARRALAGSPHFEVFEGDFETWKPEHAEFDLVVAATAWHWIDPAVRYQRAFEMLRRGGHLAFWGTTHVFPDGGDPFFVDIQEIYDEIGEGLPADTVRARPGEVEEHRDEIAASGLFDVIDVRQFDWEITYDADGYIDLLNSFSGHIVMQEWQRERLYSEVRRRLAARPDGLVRRHWGVAVHIARRRD